MQIYVVIGMTGEWSEHMEWPIAAFASEDAAKALIVTLDTIAREYGVGSRDDTNPPKDGSAIQEMLQSRFGGKWSEPSYNGYSFLYTAVEYHE